MRRRTDIFPLPRRRAHSRASLGRRPIASLTRPGSAPLPATLAIAVCFSAACLLFAAPAPAAIGSEGFGIESFGYGLKEGGSPATQAGSHPDNMTTTIVFNRHTSGWGSGFSPDGNVKDVEVGLPAGLIVNPTATAQRCTEVEIALFNEAGEPECPPGSIVGHIAATIELGHFENFPVFNMVPPPGVPADLAANVTGLLVTHIFGGVHTGAGYGITADSPEILQKGGLSSITVTLDGFPEGPAGKPLLTMPTSCGSALTASLDAESWQQETAHALFEFSPLGQGIPGVSGCGALEFKPTISLTPETHAADSPTGLHIDLHIPKTGLEEPGQLAEADLKDATVTLPAGLSVNPSSANGLAGCSSAQIGLTSKPGQTPITMTPGSARCPDAAKIGTVEVDTPLLGERNEQGEVTGPHPLKGAVYVATPKDNPFGSLLAIYIAVDDPQSGTVVKLAGHVEADPSTGRLKTTFTENPQLPFEDFRLSFFGGPGAALRTPATCGTYETSADLTPWSAPEGSDVIRTDSFQIEKGADESPTCPIAEAEEPNHPAFEAGTTTPIAGSYSPFVLHLKREDGSQPLKALNLTLPPGLSGKLAGVAECPQSGIEQAISRSHEGEGATEKANPSCPASSEIGTVNVGAGSGTPYYVQGHAYLAGPYKGAPLSMAIVTPALAGPFDLGTVVVRAGLYVNPQTAQITVKSDPIPQILDGIPLDLRSIAVDISRNQFTLNPTDCDPLAFSGEAIGASSTAALTERFQVGACNALPFAPHLALSLKGKSARAGNPALKAILTMKPGEANIARAQVTLPHSEFVDNAHIGKVCTAREFAEGNTPGERCSPESIYGYAKAWSPLLEKPVEGPVYLKTPGHKLPDLLAALNGQIDVALEGKVDSGVGGGIRNTFEVVPDAPVTKFELSMKGGAKGLLENSENICSHTQKALAHFVAQNGKVEDLHPLIANSCKSHKRHRRAHRRHR